MKSEYDIRELFKGANIIFQMGGGKKGRNIAKNTSSPSNGVTPVAAIIIMFIGLIIALLKLIFIVILLYVVVSFIYRFIVNGYPRFLLNFATFNMFHKENIDGLLQQDDVLFSTFDALSNAASDTCSGYSIIDTTYKTKTVQNIGTKIRDARKMVDDYYTKFEFESFHYPGSPPVKAVYNKYAREKHHRMFSEYYLFYKPLLVYNLNTDPKTFYYDIEGNGKPTLINWKGNTFYNTLIPYMQHNGYMNIINPKAKGKLSDEAKRYDVYQYEDKLEKNNLKTILTQRNNVHITLKYIASEVQGILQKIQKLPYHRYLFAPNSAAISQVVVSDITKYEQLINNGKIHETIKADDVNEYTWFILEVFLYNRNLSRVNSMKELWTSIVSKLKTYTGYKYNLVMTYLNLMREQRKKVEGRLMQDFSKEELELLVKFPIASRILYSVPDYIPQGSDIIAFIDSYRYNMYLGVISLYRRLMLLSCDTINSTSMKASDIQKLVSNLSIYSNKYKNTIHMLFTIDLYLNVYREDFTSMYSKRFLGTNDFFKELSTPVIDDFLTYKIKAYWQRVDLGDAKYRNGELIPKFNQIWGKIKKSVDTIFNNVWSQFGNEKKDKDGKLSPDSDAAKFKTEIKNNSEQDKKYDKELETPDNVENDMKQARATAEAEEKENSNKREEDVQKDTEEKEKKAEAEFNEREKKNKEEKAKEDAEKKKREDAEKKKREEEYAKANA